MATCSRRGCDKKLRSNNTTGECGSGCLSPDAPLAKQAPGAGKRPTVSAEAKNDSLENFKTVAKALGLDPERILGEFAQGWLDELRDNAVREID